MSEFVFAASAVAVVFLVAVPLATVAAKGLVRFRELYCVSEITRYGSSYGYAYFTAPVLVPLLWAISAALHQSEPGRGLGACLSDHPVETVCLGALALAISLCTGLSAVATASTLRGSSRGVARAVPGILVDQQRRLDVLVRRTPALTRFGSSIVAVADPSVPACVRGLLRPRIQLSAAFAKSLDDAMLTAVVLHELEHLRCADALRGVLAETALRMNPLGFLLRPGFERWRLAREIACDRHAVAAGANPPALAHALVLAARAAGARSPLPQLADSRLLGLELRVRLLLDPDEAACGCGSRRGVSLTAAALMVVVALPHLVGSEPLDSFHLVMDRAVAFFV
ncbi:MAG: M56 family metallopeptidase [Nannocystaceae bacterium]|nr:hypothetical protein [bacterium]